MITLTGINNHNWRPCPNGWAAWLARHQDLAMSSILICTALAIAGMIIAAKISGAAT